MVIVTVPALKNLPDGLYYMVTAKRISRQRLWKRLDACSDKNDGCRNCGYQAQCRSVYGRLLRCS